MSFPDFPEVHTFGRDEADALRRGRDALASILEAYIKDRRPIPAPSARRATYQIAVPARVDAKIRRYETRRRTTVGTELEAARAEIDRLRRVCAAVYQVSGALGADALVLNHLWAAAHGQPAPATSLLPYVKPMHREPDLTDPDNPEWTRADFDAAVRVADHPTLEVAMGAAKAQYQAARAARTKKKMASRSDPQRDGVPDADNPEWTADEMRTARPIAEVLPDVAAAARRGRGPQKAPRKQMVSLRLDAAVLERFRAPVSARAADPSRKADRMKKRTRVAIETTNSVLFDLFERAITARKWTQAEAARHLGIS